MQILLYVNCTSTNHYSFVQQFKITEYNISCHVLLGYCGSYVFLYKFQNYFSQFCGKRKKKHLLCFDRNFIEPVDCLEQYDHFNNINSSISRTQYGFSPVYPVFSFCHQCVIHTPGVYGTQSCLTLCDPIHCSLPGSSIHGIFQARILEWVAISFSRGSSPPMDRPGSLALLADTLPSEPPGKLVEVMEFQLRYFKS